VSRLAESEVPLRSFFSAIQAQRPVRVPGTGVFMTARPEGAPPILVHHLTHNKVLHEQVVLLTVSIENVPFVAKESSLEVERLQAGFYRVVARFGFMDTPEVPMALARAREQGLRWAPADTTYYLANLTLIPSAHIGFRWAWRDALFIVLSRNARRATNFFQIPPDRVVEIGMQLEI
jgi:KUP system potassium uptake protein